MNILNVPTGVDPMYMAILHFQERKFIESLNICNQLLSKNPRDQAAFVLKLRALSAPNIVDECELDEASEMSIGDQSLDDTATAQVPRPGTSLRAPPTSSASRALRPVTASGRPLTGFARPQASRGNETVEQAIKTARSLHTARPATSSSGRFVRLGTASLVGAGIAVGDTAADLLGRGLGDVSKQAAIPWLAKPLFEFFLYREGDIRHALDLAAAASKKCQFQDWFWKLCLAKCYLRLGLVRDAEQQLRSALRKSSQSSGKSSRQSLGPETQDSLWNDENSPTEELRLLLSRALCRMDQPAAAIKCIDEGLSTRPNNARLMTFAARIHEALGALETSVSLFTKVLQSDGINAEAVATIATHKFYDGQAESALRLFRRLLQTGLGATSHELFNNAGLCCFYSGHRELALSCFERAISLATSDLDSSDIWYNVSHVALGLGDATLGQRCLRLTLAYNPDHAEALNNLGVMELQRNGGVNAGKTKVIEMARTCFHSATAIAPHLYEPAFNMASLADQLGDLQTAHTAISKVSASFANHSDANLLLSQLKRALSSTSIIAQKN